MPEPRDRSRDSKPTDTPPGPPQGPDQSGGPQSEGAQAAPAPPNNNEARRPGGHFIVNGVAVDSEGRPIDARAKAAAPADED